MKYILIPLFKLLMLPMWYACYLVMYILPLIKFLYDLNYRKMVEWYKDINAHDFHSSHDEGEYMDIDENNNVVFKYPDTYYTYKNPLHWLIDKKTIHYRNKN